MGGGCVGKDIVSSLIVTPPSLLNLAVLRAIGIPARPITNFESAHDADSNRAIDYFYAADGNFLEGKSGDSVWLEWETWGR